MPNYASIMFTLQTPEEKLARPASGIFVGLLADAEKKMGLSTPLKIKISTKSEADFIFQLESAYKGPQDASTKWRAFVKTIIEMARESEKLSNDAFVSVKEITGVSFNDRFVAGIVKALIERKDILDFVKEPLIPHLRKAKICKAINDSGRPTALAYAWYTKNLKRLPVCDVSLWDEKDIGEMSDESYFMEGKNSV